MAENSNHHELEEEVEEDDENELEVDEEDEDNREDIAKHLKLAKKNVDKLRDLYFEMTRTFRIRPHYVLQILSEKKMECDFSLFLFSLSFLHLCCSVALLLDHLSSLLPPAASCHVRCMQLG